MGVWDLSTGMMHSTFARDNVGAKITASALSKDGNTLVLAESDYVYVWNFPYRAILSCNSELDVKEIMLTKDERRFLTVSHKAEADTEPSILVVCRTIPSGELVYSLEYNVKKFLPVG